LQDVEKMRHAVGLKAYSSQQPLDEFRLEANRAFLLLLDTYRDAVVARLMVPDLNFSLLLGQQQEELLSPDVLADMLQEQQKQQQQQQQHQQGPPSGSNGSLAGQQQQQRTAEAAGVGSSDANLHANGSTPPQQRPQAAGPAQQYDDLQPAATSAGQPSR
jgi:preprotein translocase subunit SecA